MPTKVVLFLSPVLEQVVSESVKENAQWDCHVYSTGANRTESLTDVQRLTELLQGANTCFISTSTDFSKERHTEVEEGTAIGAACKKAGVPNIILSAHLHCEKTIGVPAKHYDAKAEIYDYMRNMLDLPVTKLNIPPLYEMFFDFLCPVLNNQGGCDLVFPTAGPASIDFIALRDVGSCLLTVLENPEVFRSKTVALSGDKLTGKICTTILNEELHPMRFTQKQITIQQARERPYVGSINIANMFELLGRADLKASPSGTRELYPAVMNLSTWVRLNRQLLAQFIVDNKQTNPNLSAVV